MQGKRQRRDGHSIERSDMGRGQLRSSVFLLISIQHRKRGANPGCENTATWVAAEDSRRSLGTGLRVAVKGEQPVPEGVLVGLASISDSPTERRCSRTESNTGSHTCFTCENSTNFRKCQIEKQVIGERVLRPKRTPQRRWRHDVEGGLLHRQQPQRWCHLRPPGP